MNAKNWITLCELEFIKDTTYSYACSLQAF